MASIVARGKNGAEPFKPHAINVAEAARERMLDGGVEKDEEAILALRTAEIHQWKHHVCDLHRVLSVAQGMFLLLEHNNEALLRVAIEIVCDQAATRVLWWTEEWYSDEDRRIYFREMVMGMLSKCLAYMNVEPELDSTRVDELLKELELMRERAAKAEASRDALEKNKKAIEAQVGDLEAQLNESQQREKEFKNANEKLQNELRLEREKGLGGPDPDLVKQMADLEAKLKASEEQKALLQERLKKAEAKDGAAAALAKMAEELAAAQANMDELEQRLKQERDNAEAAERKAADAAKEIAKLKAEANAKPKAKQEKVEKDDRSGELEEEVQGLQKSLEDEKLRGDKLSGQNDRLNKDLAAMKAELERLKNAPQTVIVEKEVKVAESKHEDDSPIQKVEVVEVHEVKRQKVHDEDTTPTAGPKGFSQEEWDAKCRELEKAMAKIAAQNSKIKELKDDKEALELRNDKMLKMLHQLKDQLKRVTEIAEKKGCGDLIKSIFEEANITDTLNSAEFTCFDRLYEDAKRRQEKDRVWREERMGLRPKTEASRSRTVQDWEAQQRGQTRSNSPTPQWDQGVPSSNVGSYAPNAGTFAPNPGTYSSPNSLPAAQNIGAASPFFPQANWFPGGPDPMALPGLAGASPAKRALMQDELGYGSEWMNYDECFDGMKVVGREMGRSLSTESGGWSRQSIGRIGIGDMRASTPAGTRSSPSSFDPGRKSQPDLGMRPSSSAGSLSSLSFGVQSVRSVPNLSNDGISSVIPFRKKLVHSQSTARMEDLKLEDNDPILANNVWAGAQSGAYNDRLAGPGMFRGVKLVQRGKRQLSPVLGGLLHSKMPAMNVDDILQTKSNSLFRGGGAVTRGSTADSYDSLRVGTPLVRASTDSAVF